MNNPKTTISGYVAVVGAIAYVVYRLASGQSIDMNDLLAIVAAITGAGLIAAKDGSH